ncbi:beta-glucan synthesis-associated protein [Mycena vitilis]|nr:beta-glucan synthesis-associated protein [Mycena vitilis]
MSPPSSPSRYTASSPSAASAQSPMSPTTFPTRQSSITSPRPGGRLRPQASFSRKPKPAPNLRGNDAGSLPEESRYLLSRSGSSSLQPSISEKFHLAADPEAWGAHVSEAEADDALHDPRRDYKNTHNVFTGRGLQNVGCMVLLCLTIVGVFLGYPVTSHFKNTVHIDDLHINATGQIPSIGNWGLIDLDTPKEFYNIRGYHDPSETLQLVFSDEFEMEGRSFYPGDDPYWEAVDLHYWQTGNLEWYDPAAITTRKGALEINLTKVDDPALNHNLNYTGGMMSSWNKFCFTGGIIVTSVMLPGTNNVLGLWPAVWTMGNLGRAGYGATLDGMWPYVYDACDIGTLANQTLNGAPAAALDSGPEQYNGSLSYLPGQRLSRCTCSGESHPGPMHEDGTYVGRSAPEIDIFDDAHVGTVSQSAQWAPFNAGYEWDNSSASMSIPDPTLTKQNSYLGAVYQQATSGLTNTDQKCYQLLEACYSVYGFEYVPGYDDAYISWISDNKVAWTMTSNAVGADPITEISARPVTDEPMYILANLGISPAFGYIDFENLIFPATMRIDWIRVYQHPDKINVGCDTPAKPTSAYIDAYMEAYTNPLLTTWTDDYKQPVPKNKLVDKC